MSQPLNADQELVSEWLLASWLSNKFWMFSM